MTDPWEVTEQELWDQFDVLRWADQLYGLENGTAAEESWMGADLFDERGPWVDADNVGPYGFDDEWEPQHPQPYVPLVIPQPLLQPQPPLQSQPRSRSRNSFIKQSNSVQSRSRGSSMKQSNPPQSRSKSSSVKQSRQILFHPGGRGPRPRTFTYTKSEIRERPFPCTEESCGYRGVDKKHLREHIRDAHSRHNLFPCRYCDYQTNRKSTIATHERTHTGEKPFACLEDSCPMRFSQASNMKAHVRVHHPDLLS